MPSDIRVRGIYAVIPYLLGSTRIYRVIVINSLQDIVTVDQIDVFFVAPSDLAQTMGYTGQPTHPEVLTVVDRCIAQIVAAGKVPGHIGNAETVESYIEKGVQFS